MNTKRLLDTIGYINKKMGRELMDNCVSCGHPVTDGNPKAKNPVRYKSGKRKGEEKKCCKDPNLRHCNNKHCEAETAIMCLNCGKYYGDITW